MGTPETLRNRFTLGFAGLVIVASLAGALYMKRVADARTPRGRETDAEPLPTVEVATIAPRSIPIVFDVRGFLSGFEEVTVHSEVSGRVVGKPVRDGQHVEPGAILCGIDETLYRLTVRKAQANLGVAQGRCREAKSAIAVADAQRNDAQAARDNAHTEFERIRGLYRDRESAEIEYERYETLLKRAEAQLLSAKAAYDRALETEAVSQAAVRVAESAVDEAQEFLSRCRVRAPIAGTIDRTEYEVGEYVVAGQPLVEIIRLDQMKLIVQLTGPQVATLGDASRAEVAVDAVPGVVYAGVLSHVAPKADATTRKFRVEFHVENEAGRLRAGMFARAGIQSTVWKDVIAAPRDAFSRRFGAEFCFVIKDDEARRTAQLRRVLLEDIPGRIEQVRVAEGLSPRERLVIKRPRHLKDGAAVNIVEREEVGVSPGRGAVNEEWRMEHGE